MGGISLVFREIWDSTALSWQLLRFDLSSQGGELRFVVSHISRKTSEIWGTRCPLTTKLISSPPYGTDRAAIGSSSGQTSAYAWALKHQMQLQ